MQNELEAGAIARRFRQFPRERPRQIRDAGPAFILSVVVCAVVNIFPNPSIRYHAGPLQLREMTGDARLAHAQNLLKFRHRKLFLFEKQEQAQPGRIRQQSEQIYG